MLYAWALLLSQICEDLPNSKWISMLVAVRQPLLRVYDYIKDVQWCTCNIQQFMQKNHLFEAMQLKYDIKLSV